MEVLKIKDWLNKPRPQFKIEKTYDGGETKRVTRIKDGQEFSTFKTFVTERLIAVTITWFHEDLIHVDIDISRLGHSTTQEKCEIDSLVIGEKINFALKPPTDLNV